MSDSMKKQFRAKYEPHEDEVILAMAKEAQSNGIALNIAYLAIADKLQRPFGSIVTRYRRLMRLPEGETISYSKVSPKQMSEGDRLAAKLRALKRDHVRSTEKTDMYKDRYDNLTSEFEELKKKYSNLEAEHQRLIKTVKEALGEDEDENNVG